uniref:Small ribosomal subunit protein uS2c n=1 Tax=Colacium vesiculosum TaxID=102910 RepID=I6NIR2_9EUGL|nr:ribosomal protein S2 [Colacium vesiculosum]
MITLQQLLGSSVHLGHYAKEWNPKMRPYIYCERDGIHIIDLLQTIVCLEKACNFLSNASKKKKSFLFVGTKPQFSAIIQSCALSCNAHYVTERWLGGMLTNWFTMESCIKKLKILSEQELNGNLNRLTKKEIVNNQKRKLKLEKYLSGVKDLKALPDIVILVGQTKDINAVKECLKLGIPIVTILDTNCDPDLANFAIPANDDSVASIALILNELSKSISLA